MMSKIQWTAPQGGDHRRRKGDEDAPIMMVMIAMTCENMIKTHAQVWLGVHEGKMGKSRWIALLGGGHMRWKGIEVALLSIYDNSDGNNV